MFSRHVVDLCFRPGFAGDGGRVEAILCRKVTFLHEFRAGILNASLNLGTAMASWPKSSWMVYSDKQTCAQLLCVIWNQQRWGEGGGGAGVGETCWYSWSCPEVLSIDDAVRYMICINHQLQLPVA